jgi:predicted TIM-barrel fold metal-dependent hydrolase
MPRDVICNGRIYVSCEAEERSLPGVLAAFPASHILYASDFPHEMGYDPAAYAHDLAEFTARADLSTEAKQAILAGSAERFYGLRAGAAVGR